MFVDNLFSCFFSNVSITYIVENDKVFECKVTASNYSANTISEIHTSKDFLLLNDLLSLTVVFGEADPITYYSGTSDLQEFVNKLNEEYIHQEDEPINCNLLITKDGIGNNVSIYDLNTFYSTLANLSTAEVFIIFTRLFFTRNCIIFNTLNLNQAFNTATIFFIPSSYSTPSCQFEDRQKRIDGLQAIGHYLNAEEHVLTPEDFKIIVNNDSYNDLTALLNIFSIALSVVYLFDITSLNNNELEFKINGYKSIAGKIDVKTDLIKGTEQYFNIYLWVYNGGNLSDKVGLARNIISLHFAIRGQLELHGNPFQSIQSSYKVYEKQNIKQYIEIRNKISDQLLDFNNRANKLIETFASGFQKSALALISFYISAIVIRVLSKGDFIGVFSLDATVLSIAFIIGSVIYYLVSRWEVKEQRKRFESSYTNLKERYTDLLDKEDIKRILNDDAEFKADINFINQKLKNYSRMWVAFLLILFFTTMFLFFVYNLSQIFDTQLGGFIMNKKCNC